jgi:hypothetical protein
MATRPAFQFYPADWRLNANLRRCSAAARGVWVDVLCLLHDSDEYGVLRWPLADIAQSAGAPLELLEELAQKKVLKGADANGEDYKFAPSHAGKLGDEVTLVAPGDGPCWYCSRFVKDEFIRQRRGAATRFDSENQPPKAVPNTKPTRRVGVRQGDGASASSSFASSNQERGAKAPPRKRGKPPTFPMPDDFGISERVEKWAKTKGHSRLAEHLERFRSKAKAKAYVYADWDEAFMTAIREDWAKLPAVASSAVPRGKPSGPSETPLEAQLNWIAQTVRGGGMTTEEAEQARAAATEKHRRRA